jgi:hypothetical protein
MSHTSAPSVISPPRFSYADWAMFRKNQKKERDGSRGNCVKKRRMLVQVLQAGFHAALSALDAAHSQAAVPVEQSHRGQVKEYTQLKPNNIYGTIRRNDTRLCIQHRPQRVGAMQWSAFAHQPKPSFIFPPWHHLWG